MQRSVMFFLIGVVVSLVAFACKFRIGESALLADGSSTASSNGKVICRDYAADVNTELDKLAGQITSISQPNLIGTPPVLCVSVTYK